MTHDEKSAELVELFPKLFSGRWKSVGVGPGWYNIITELCYHIDSHVEWKQRQTFNDCSDVVIEQIKEKYGTLRFYYSGGDSTVDSLVSLAESMSSYTCEECGKPGAQVSTGGWIKTLCDEHKNEYLKKIRI